MRFVFLFLVMIGLEIWSMIKVGQHIGVLATFVLLIAGFIIGTQVIRAQGIASLMQSFKQMKGGQSPVTAIAAGLINAFAGILFILPGFISDAIAICLLLPFVRNALVARMLSKGNIMTFAANKFGAGFNVGGIRPGAANDQFGGNIYEHEGRASSPTKPVNNLEQNDDVIEGEIIDQKPERK